MSRPTMLKTCPVCDKPFKARAEQKCCSLSCAATLRPGRSSIQQRRRPEVACPNCGTKFFQRVNQKACSYRCSVAMRPKPDQPWRAEAERLKAEGLSSRQIAALLKVSSSQIRYALNPETLDRANATRRARAKIERAEAAKAKRKAYERQRAAGKQAILLRPGSNGECGFFAAHQYRKPRQIINYAALSEIIAKGRGDIPLEELMSRISAS